LVVAEGIGEVCVVRTDMALQQAGKLGGRGVLLIRAGFDATAAVQI
jgi:hypothetical protein